MWRLSSLEREKWLLTEEDGSGQCCAINIPLGGEKRSEICGAEGGNGGWGEVNQEGRGVSGEKPAKRRHHQTEMLKVRSLKDGVLNRGVGLLLR